MINCDLKKIDKNIPIVVGVSAGPDSMALLHYLKNNSDNKIICCHVNHNVRKESKKEAIYLKQFCDKNNLIFEQKIINEYNSNNFENEARIKRYSFYEEILKKYNSKYLFLAHHGDDLIETVLMKIVRGSNLEGYAGIKKVSKMQDYYIIRPLLEYTKNDLITYNKKNSIKYFIDKSNKSNCYTRNRYRKYILPFLKKENKEVHKNFLKYSECLQEYFNYVKEEANLYLKQVYNNKYFTIDEFNKLLPFLQKNIIYSFLNNIYDNKSNIVKEKNVNDILKLINSNKPNAYINLPKGLVAIKEYNKLYINKEDICSDYYIPLEDYNIINNHIIKSIKDNNENGNDICRLNSKELKLPLYIRNKREKDIIYVKGLNGSKKVKDIFIDEKIPLSKRKDYPLLVDSEGNILWIPMIKKSKFDYEKNNKYDIILKYCEKEEYDEEKSS